MVEKQVDELLGRVASGDRSAFDRFYSLYFARAFGVALRVLLDEDQAQEVTQEVFLQLWQQAHRFDAARGSTSAWVRRVAFARAVDRSQARQAAIARDARYAAASQLVDYDMVVEQAVLKEEAATLRRSVLRLATLQRESVVLAFYAGLSTMEISQHLGVKQSTVKTRIRDGLRKLSAELRTDPISPST